ncbi:hypothetical protein HQN89_30670 [Paenibacillus frigoriresistens]|nr:hypothetical protein [Paenibacillus frigoriresistens]
MVKTKLDAFFASNLLLIILFQELPAKCAANFSSTGSKGRFRENLM